MATGAAADRFKDVNGRDPDQTRSEHELVARCRRGDREAQRALYEQTSDRIYRLLVRMTRSQETAEDLTQETYLKAFSAIETFDGRSAVHTWLYRIAVNEALQSLRRKRPTGLDPEFAAHRPDPRDNGHDWMGRIDVEAAIAELDPMDRAVLLLRYQEGLDYQAIAGAAGIPMGTVASRLNRARERLREVLGDYAPIREETRPDTHPSQGGTTGSDPLDPAASGRTYRGTAS